MSLVLYDCTTLYFQTEVEDDLRRVGMSKERRVDPQVQLGLLVDAAGFPLEVVCFEGNTAETRTLIPTLQAFQDRHGVRDLVVVADAGMLSAANLNAVEDAGFSFVVGSRISKAPYDLAAHFTRHGDYFTDGQILRFRFVRFAADEKQATTLAMLAECFEVLGAVPKTVLADRMACLKGGVVAGVVVPVPDYVRFAAHYRFRPDFCHAADPESKGIVENLVGYAKDDLLVPLALDDDPWGEGLAGLNERAAAWCEEVNAAVHSEICAIPEQRLGTERELLGG